MRAAGGGGGMGAAEADADEAVGWAEEGVEEKMVGLMGRWAVSKVVGLLWLRSGRAEAERMVRGCIMEVFLVLVLVFDFLVTSVLCGDCIEWRRVCCDERLCVMLTTESSK
jgi:hypothetical protein